jgi:septal ring factor EnvC (AmiA/AmiB activator)
LQILHAGEVGFIREDARLVEIIRERPAKTPEAREEESQTTDRQIDTLKQQAREIDRKIESGKAKLETYTQKEIDTINRLNALNFELHKSRKRLAAIKTEIMELEKTIAVNEAASTELKKQIQTNENFMAHRLVALYKLNQIGQFNILATADNINELIERKRALERILAYDEAIRKKLEKDRHELKANLTQLTRQKTEIGRLAQKYERQLKRVSADQSKRKKILVQIRNQKSMELAAIETLKKYAHELDREIRSMRKKTVSSSDSRNLAEKPIDAFKGLLKMPVKGRITFLFGPYKNPKFNVTNFRSGIGIKVKEGEPVRAVFKGTVVFASWFKGYGNMIIIDHGTNYHTVYAHLEELFKTTGDLVETEEVIATVGDTGLISEITLHFEIRHHGKPLDPMHWLKHG